MNVEEARRRYRPLESVEKGIRFIYYKVYDRQNRIHLDQCDVYLIMRTDISPKTKVAKKQPQPNAIKSTSNRKVQNKGKNCLNRKQIHNQAKKIVPEMAAKKRMDLRIRS